MFEKSGGIENLDNSGTCWLTYRVTWNPRDAEYGMPGHGTFSFAVRLAGRWFAINASTTPDLDR